MLFFKRKPKATKARKAGRKRRGRTARPKVKKAAKKAAPAAQKGREVLVGAVSHYFPHVKAGAIKIKSGTVAVGDTLHIKGHTTDFKQKVKSLQIDRVPVEKASKGDEIGVLVRSRVRINDKVYKLKA